MQYKEGQPVWVKMPWIDSEMAVRGEFLAETAKRHKVFCSERGGVIYVAKHNIKPIEG